MKFITTLLITLLLIIGANNMAKAKNNDWEKVFPKSDKVNVESTF